MKRLFLVLGGVLALAALLAAWSIARTFPRESGTIRVPGHAGAIRIDFDAHGVPTIHARSIEDAMFGLGYVHAKDRLWQLEFERRVGSGRLAEILGRGLLDADRFLRTIGFRQAAEATWRGLPPESRLPFEAYARGVNAFVATSSSRPIEFRLLRVDPEPWRPEDSLVWAKMMAWDLAGNARDEIRLARFAAAVGPERAAELLPVASAEPSILTPEEWTPPRPGAGSAGSRSGVAEAPGDPFESPWGPLAARFDALDALGFGGETLGSNSWVLSGARTASGYPILANDPHLGLKTPSVWYLAAIDAPGYRMSGATLPGIPSVIIGHNDRIAWGVTSIEPDVQDLFVETVDPADPGRYRNRGEWKSFSVRNETIHVRGAPDVPLVVRGSVHGPIVTDVFGGAASLGKAVALRWTGLDDGDRTAEAFFGLGRARDWNGFLAAAALLKVPPQNLVYADVEGHIGFVAAGDMPIRPRADGRLPVSGEGDDDWAGVIPFEQLPRVLDPAKGYVVAANNRLVSGPSGNAYGLNWAEPYRAKRIRDAIEAKPRWSVADSAALQLDRGSGQADDLLPLLLDTTPLDAASRDALERLRGWNREMAPDSVPASIYAALYVALAKMPEDELGLGGVPRGSTRGRFLVRALSGNSAWCDDVRTPIVETCSDFKAAALRDALALLRRTLGPDPSAWRWERLHHARFPHDVFHQVAGLRRIFDLSVGQGGDGSTVNVGAFSQDGSFDMTDGPSYRQVIDLSDLARSRYVHTTGQSGNVFDRRYRDLLPEWLAGRSFEIGTAAPVTTLVLEP
ncbi:MAG TPA: penicillin acylase family protein [Thermoanaerobaculia bacterium]